MAMTYFTQSKAHFNQFKARGETNWGFTRRPALLSARSGDPRRPGARN